MITDNVLHAWCAAERNEKQWLQIDLQENKDIMALALQGLYQHSWVESFYIQYSIDGETWYCYGSENGHKVMCLNEVVLFVVNIGIRNLFLYLQL